MLEEKAIALVSTVQDYKKATSNPEISKRAGTTRKAGIDLVEKRLEAMEVEVAKEVAKNWYYKIFSIR